MTPAPLLPRMIRALAFAETIGLTVMVGFGFLERLLVDPFSGQPPQGWGAVPKSETMGLWAFLWSGIAIALTPVPAQGRFRNLLRVARAAAITAGATHLLYAFVSVMPGFDAENVAVHVAALLFTGLVVGDWDFGPAAGVTPRRPALRAGGLTTGSYTLAFILAAALTGWRFNPGHAAEMAVLYLGPLGITWILVGVWSVPRRAARR